MTLITSRLTPEFRYSVESQRYIAANGRYVSRETVKAANELIVTQSQADIKAVSERFYNGEITHAEWDAQMRLSNRRGCVASTVVASGGFENMTPAKWGRAGALVKEQNQYLNGMGERIQSGYYGDDLSKNGFMAHATSYGLAPRGVFEYVQGMNAIEDLGHDEVANVLDHNREQACKGDGSCQQMTDYGWIKVDSEIFKTKWRWPGSRLCIGNCRCGAKTRDSKAAQMREAA